ncbi:hypothetical protein EDB19DRAFT_1840794 [Suillus lakei]|nr:hypothetical protein EDB19DRAFT_1840794 [Suillus lakei]
MSLSLTIASPSPLVLKVMTASSRYVMILVPFSNITGTDRLGQQDSEECTPSDSEYTVGLQAIINKLELDIEDLMMQKQNDEEVHIRYHNQISDLQVAIHRQHHHLLDLTEHARHLEEETNAQKMEIKELINRRMHDDIRRAECIMKVKEKISEMLLIVHL